MNLKTFPHPEQAPLGAGTGVAARQHPSRTIFPHAPQQALAGGRVLPKRQRPSGW